MFKKICKVFATVAVLGSVACSGSAQMTAATPASVQTEEEDTAALLAKAEATLAEADAAVAKTAAEPKAEAQAPQAAPTPAPAGQQPVVLTTDQLAVLMSMTNAQMNGGVMAMAQNFASLDVPIAGCGDLQLKITNSTGKFQRVFLDTQVVIDRSNGGTLYLPHGASAYVCLANPGVHVITLREQLVRYNQMSDAGKADKRYEGEFSGSRWGMSGLEFNVGPIPARS